MIFPIVALFEKTKETECDIFECIETLKRKEYDEYAEQKDTILQRIQPVVEVKFQNVR